MHFSYHILQLHSHTFVPMGNTSGNGEVGSVSSSSERSSSEPCASVTGGSGGVWDVGIGQGISVEPIGGGMWVKEGEDDGGDRLGEGSRGVMVIGAEGGAWDLSWDLVTTQMLDDSFSSFSS